MKKNYDTKYIFMLSIPIFVELFLQMLVGNVDQIMLSAFSQSAVASIGNGNQIMNLFILVLNMMASAITILISQYLGANKKEKVNETINVSLLVMSVASIAITLLLFLFYRPIFQVLSLPDELFYDTRQYLLVVTSFLLVQGLFMAFSSILRSYAMVKQSMLIALLMNGLNIIGNAILINGWFGLPRLGILGAAISTNLSKLVGLLLLIWIFYRSQLGELSFRYLRPFPKACVKELCAIALPSGAEAFSYNLSQTMILKFVNLMGTAVITARVYCLMMANVAYVYCLAIAQATQIVIGYLVGQKQYDEIIKRVRICIAISLTITLSITAITFLLSDFCFGIFTQDPLVLKICHTVMLIEFFVEIGKNFNIVLVRAMLTVYDVKIPVVVGVISTWCVAVFLSYVFGLQWGYGLAGVWFAMGLDEAVRAIIFFFRFKSRKWVQLCENSSLHKQSIEMA